jgi:hypothetical protein
VRLLSSHPFVSSSASFSSSSLLSSSSVTGTALATRLYHHTHIYIATLLHRSSINSVLLSITTIRESYEPGFAYRNAEILKFTHLPSLWPYSLSLFDADHLASLEDTGQSGNIAISRYLSTRLLVLSFTQAITNLLSNMASIETQRTTRTVVILTKPEEWSLWLFQHKDKAASYGVWEYCDPSVSAPPALGLKPERPMLPQGDLTADILQTQRIRLSEWEWEYKEWH